MKLFPRACVLALTTLMLVSPIVTEAASSYLRFTGHSRIRGTVRLAGFTLPQLVGPISISTASLPLATLSTAYNQSVSATGGTGTYTFAISFGSLPSGLSMSSAGVITGTPSGTGASLFFVTATDPRGNVGTRALTLTVGPLIVLSPSSLTSGTVNSAYSQAITASGGTASYTYAVTSGALPTGMSLSSGGSLSGTPSVFGTFNFTITATDANAFTGARAYTLVIAPVIAVAPASLLSGIVNSSYSQAITASGGTASYTYAVTSGALPTGMSLSSGGTLSGTPTVFGSFNFTITATDANAYTGARAYTLVIAPVIAVAPSSLTSGTVNSAYSQAITASGGTASYTYAISSGSLPTGMTLSSGGSLSGTPTVFGTFGFTIVATDANSFTGARTYSLVIAPVITLSPSTLTDATQNTAYTQAITASGGTASYTYAVTSGTLPTGMTVSSGGTLSGTPTNTGTFNFTVTATDANSFTGARAYTLIVVTGVTPGSQDFTTPGTTSFTVPAYNNLTVTVWGGGGGGGAACNAGAAGNGGAGGQSSFNAAVIGNGGGSGGGGFVSGQCAGANTGGAGGSASGGTTNTTGGAGVTSGTFNAPGGTGGTSPNGGTGGSGGATGSANVGSPGGTPGAGGGGGSLFFAGSGGGAGGYSTKTYTTGQLSVGASITVVVGGGGSGGVAGNSASNGGAGARGQVSISWN